MSKIYRTSDVIELKIDDLKVGVSPLSFDQKMEVQAQMLSGKAVDAMKGAALAVKYALKKIDGLKDSNGNVYELQFENGKLTDQCWDDLQSISESQRLTSVCLNLLNRVPDEFVDLGTGKKLEGVSRIRQEKSSAKK